LRRSKVKVQFVLVRIDIGNASHTHIVGFGRNAIKISLIIATDSDACIVCQWVIKIALHRDSKTAATANFISARSEIKAEILTVSRLILRLR
jgi:hypothetical protein